MCATLFLLMGMVGLAFDFGRVYVAHNEMQLYTDAAALLAASKLDATEAGTQASREAIEKFSGRWNFGNSEIAGAKLEFSDDGARWVETASVNLPASKIRMARVSVPSIDVPIAFLRVVGTPAGMKVDAVSVAGVGPVRLVQ